MGCVIQFSLFDTQTWFLFIFEAIEGCLVFKYLASVGEKTRTTIKKNTLLDNDFLSPAVKQREKRAKKKVAGVKRDAARLTTVQKLSRVSTKGTLPP